ncbi:uncharacterized protein BXZ73DRAFT_40017 [Epithele typhae]|uniref:uncharacterized protein n=1 Tax=Epithele typhae TaxID=378194 RepID=UPI002007DC10|nr:uncharacterized protein BXZ73DRAFT_40017 [Epithele typhae]KAH9944038.1 hypothetical protein BXZ73DRAFT_40017 [Epithele typhae]
MSRVPHELSDYIIDFLHDNPKALGACALTSPSWLFASRFHLFRALSLDGRARVRSLQRLLHAAPDLGLYVRDLAVSKLSTDSLRKHLVPVPSAIDHNVETTFPRVLALLPALRTLTISHTDMNCLGALDSLPLSSVASLSLSFCQFSDFADVVDFVGRLPTLSALSLSGLTWKDERRAPHAIPLPALRTLALGRDLDLEHIFEWLAAAGVHEHLTSLKVRCANAHDADLVGPFLAQAGTSLRELDLDWSFTGDQTILLPDSVSLGDCTALSALSLRFPVHYSAHLPWVAALLATLAPAPQPLRSLACDIRLLGNIDAAFDWPALSAVLASEAFAGLEALRFAVHLWPGVHRDMGEVAALVRAGLAPLDKRGLVHVAKA